MLFSSSLPLCRVLVGSCRSWRCARWKITIDRIGAISRKPLQKANISCGWERANRLMPAPVAAKMPPKSTAGFQFATKDRQRLQGVIGYFREYGEKYDFDYLMVAAQGYQESGLDQTVVSRVGAIGIMQLMPATAREMGFDDISTAEANIEAGAKYMRHVIDTYFSEYAAIAADDPLAAFGVPVETEGGADAVGHSTTNAVVSSIVLIALADGPDGAEVLLEVLADLGERFDWPELEQLVARDRADLDWRLLDLLHAADAHQVDDLAVGSRGIAA